MHSPPITSQSIMEQHITFAVATIVGVIILCGFLDSSGDGGIVDMRVRHLANSNSSNQTPSLLANQTEDPPTSFLLTTLCGDKCKRHCRQYQTPLLTCFQGASLFPDDPSWNTSASIFDSPINATHFQRDFYEHGSSCDHPCHGPPTDGFTLPYHTCVGPFGAPRPWGTFQILSLSPCLQCQET